MRTKLSTLCSVLFFAFFIISCCDDCNYAAFSIANEIETTSLTHDICCDKPAVLEPPSCYNTKSGKALLYIPVPDGHTLKKVSQTDSSVKFETNGKDFTSSYKVYKVIVSGLKKEAGNKLTIDVKIGGNDRCNSCPTGTLGEKNKNSVIDGVPYTGCVID